MKTLTTAIWVCTAFLLLLTTASKAMGSIRISEKGRICGFITDATTGKPLDSVSVDLYTISGSKLVVGTLTNNKGEFNLTMLEPGDYYLDISMPGYSGFRVKSIKVKKDAAKIDVGEIQLSKISKKAAKLAAKNKSTANEINLAINNL